MNEDEIYSRFISIMTSLAASSPSAFAFPAFVKPSIHRGRVTWRQCVVVRFWHPEENQLVLHVGGPPSSFPMLQHQHEPMLEPLPMMNQMQSGASRASHATGPSLPSSSCSTGRDVRERMQLRGFALFPEEVEWRRAVESVAMRRMRRKREKKQSKLKAPLGGALVGVNADGEDLMDRGGENEPCVSNGGMERRPEGSDGGGCGRFVPAPSEVGVGERLESHTSLASTHDHTAQATTIAAVRPDVGDGGSLMISSGFYKQEVQAEAADRLVSSGAVTTAQLVSSGAVTTTQFWSMFARQQPASSLPPTAQMPLAEAGPDRGLTRQNPLPLSKGVKPLLYLLTKTKQQDKTKTKTEGKGKGKGRDGGKKRKADRAFGSDSEEEPASISRGQHSESSIQAYETRMKGAALGSEESGETLTKLAMACGCNGHWDNLAYWTFKGPYKKFPRLREMDPESIVRHFLGSVEEFRSFWCNKKEDSKEWGDPMEGGGKCSRSSDEASADPREVMLLDMSKVGAIAALGHLGLVLSSQPATGVGSGLGSGLDGGGDGGGDAGGGGGVTVIPRLKDYVNIVAMNRQLPQEMRRPMVKYMLYRSLRKVPRLYPFTLLDPPPLSQPLSQMEDLTPCIGAEAKSEAKESRPQHGVVIIQDPLPVAVSLSLPPSSLSLPCNLGHESLMKPEWIVRQYLSLLLSDDEASNKDVNHLRSLLYLGSDAYLDMRREFAVGKGTPFVTTAEALQWVKSDEAVVELARRYNIHLVGEGEGIDDEGGEEEEEEEEEEGGSKRQGEGKVWSISQSKGKGGGVSKGGGVGKGGGVRKVKKGGINLGFRPPLTSHPLAPPPAHGPDPSPMMRIDWSSVQWSVDHIVPRSLHGLDHPCNYCLMPTRVNSAFGARVVTFYLQGQGQGEGQGEGQGQGDGGGACKGGGLKEEVVGSVMYREAVRFHRTWMGALMPSMINLPVKLAREASSLPLINLPVTLPSACLSAADIDMMDLDLPPTAPPLDKAPQLDQAWPPQDQGMDQGITISLTTKNEVPSEILLPPAAEEEQVPENPSGRFNCKR